MNPDSKQPKSPLSKGPSISRHPAPVHESFMDHWLVMPKGLYFMLNMFVYGFHGLQYLIFTQQYGFPYYMYGYATTIIGTNFFGAMLWSSLADKTGRYKMIIIITSIIYTIVACAMGYFRMGDPGTMEYVIIFVGFGLFNFFLSAAFPLLDSQIMGMLATKPNVSKDQFGYQRMWGAVGHFAATMLSYTIYDKHNTTNQVIFQLIISAIFILAVLFGVKDVKPVKHGHGAPAKDDKGKSKEESGELHQVPLSTALPSAPTPAPPAATDELAAEGTSGVKHPIIALLTNPSFMFFMFFILLSGVIRAVGSAYQKALGMDAAKGDKIWTALLDFGRMLSEMAIYPMSKYLKNIFGIYWILVLSQLVGILRLVGYGLIDTKQSYAYYTHIGFELLKGLSSGMVSSSAIAIASRIAPPGCESSAQGLFSGNYSGLSMAVTGVISGAIMQYQYDPAQPDKQIQDTQNLYLIISVSTFIVTLMVMAKFIFLDRVMGIPGFPRRHSLPS